MARVCHMEYMCHVADGTVTCLRRFALSGVFMTFALTSPMCPTVSTHDIAQTSRQRAWLDFHITSHIPFCVSVAYSVYWQFYELALLTGLVVICSVRYHRNRERVCVAAYMDNAAASLLVLYGICQMFVSPSKTILLVHLLAMFLVIVTFMLPFFDEYRHLYPTIHPIGMHIIPALWCVNVATFQYPFLVIRL